MSNTNTRRGLDWTLSNGLSAIRIESCTLIGPDTDHSREFLISVIDAVIMPIIHIVIDVIMCEDNLRSHSLHAFIQIVMSSFGSLVSLLTTL